MSLFRTALTSFALIALTAPTFAGGLIIDKAPNKGVFKQSDTCALSRARTVLGNNDMMVLADVPRTNANYRFVVDWKRQMFAVNVRVSDCAIDVVDYAQRVHPYCEYIPGILANCGQELQLAQ
ncbi:MAG: hypothetical protein ABIQ30_00290 [Devosia sp.]